MSKEMTPKEAIERIIENLPTYKGFLDDITVVKQATTDYEQLQRDVKRYFELENQDTFNSQAEYDEYGDLVDKLMKVGNEE